MNKKEIKIRHAQAEKELKFTTSYLAQVEMLSKIQKDINQAKLTLSNIISAQIYPIQALTITQIKNYKDWRREKEDKLNNLKREYKRYQRGLEVILNITNNLQFLDYSIVITTSS